MTNRSIREILANAFLEIQEQHGIALSSMSLDLVDVSQDGQQKYMPVNINFEGKALVRRERSGPPRRP